MANALEDQVWEINASIAALGLLMRYLLIWHFQTRKYPRRAAKQFSDQVQHALGQGTMPGFDPVVSDHSVGMVQDRVHHHMQHVLGKLEDAT